MEKESSSKHLYQNVPKLRFPGFEGEWRTISFSDLFEILPNNTLSRAELSDNGEIKNIHYGDVLIKYGDTLDLSSDIIPYINTKSSVKRNDVCLRNGDIIIADTAEDETVGKAVELYNGDNIKSVSGLHTIPCRPKTCFASMFLGYYINSYNYRKQLIALMQGIKVLSISKSNIAKTIIAYPSNKEQQKIATFLSLIDDRISKQRELVEKLKTYKRGALSVMFPQKGETVPRCRFASFSGDWEKRKLGDLVLIERGGSPRPIDDYITDSPDGLNWVKIGDAPEQGQYITKTAEKIKPEGLSKTRQVQPGDLILSNSMSFGKPYIMGINGCIHDGWLLIRNTHSCFDLKFLCHMLGTDQMIDQYKMFAAGSTVNNLNKELVGSTVVSLPSITEQKVIGEYLESIDHLITLHQNKLDMLIKTKQSLLQQLFI